MLFFLFAVVVDIAAGLGAVVLLFCCCGSRYYARSVVINSLHVLTFSCELGGYSSFHGLHVATFFAIRCLIFYCSNTSVLDGKTFLLLRLFKSEHIACSLHQSLID
jgi:hypothetical protein